MAPRLGATVATAARASVCPRKGWQEASRTRADSGGRVPVFSRTPANALQENTPRGRPQIPARDPRPPATRPRGQGSRTSQGRVSSSGSHLEASKWMPGVSLKWPGPGATLIQFFFSFPPEVRLGSLESEGNAHCHSQIHGTKPRKPGWERRQKQLGAGGGGCVPCSISCPAHPGKVPSPP